MEGAESEKRDRNVVRPLVGAPRRFLWVRMVSRGGGDLCAVGEASETPWVGSHTCFWRFQAPSSSLGKTDNGPWRVVRACEQPGTPCLSTETVTPDYAVMKQSLCLRTVALLVPGRALDEHVSEIFHACARPVGRCLSAVMLSPSVPHGAGTVALPSRANTAVPGCERPSGVDLAFSSAVFAQNHSLPNETDEISTRAPSRALQIHTCATHGTPAGPAVPPAPPASPASESPASRGLTEPPSRPPGPAACTPANTCKSGGSGAVGHVAHAA
eukprot:7382626-Prymnesium_polylepis.1